MASVSSARRLIDLLPGPAGAAAEALRRERAIRRFTETPRRRTYPGTADALRASPLLATGWYYSVELLPAVVSEGQHPAEMPMLPRIMLRHCDVRGQSCLDVGAMEGLVPVLLRKRGAADVLAVDFSNHALGKLAAVRAYHGVDFDFRAVGLMYGLRERLGGRSFDLVNLSGLLYHVLSPMHVLAAVRPLLRRRGLLVLSTYVTLDPAPVMDFNAGRLWGEGNTFWFPSVALLDYLLRYLRLLPVDCSFLPARELRVRPGALSLDRVGLGKPAGYLSVICRAVDRYDGDAWMRESWRSSWELHGLVDWPLAEGRPESGIRLTVDEPAGGLDLHAAVAERAPVVGPAALDDSHTLMLDATA